MPRASSYSRSFSSTSSASKTTTSKTKSTNTKSSYVPDTFGTSALGFAGGYVLGNALSSHSSTPSLTTESVQIAKEKEQHNPLPFLLLVCMLIGFGYWLICRIIDRMDR